MTLGLRFFLWLFGPSEDINAPIAEMFANAKWHDHRKQCRPQASTRTILFGATKKDLP
jgi:hypothetical protein